MYAAPLGWETFAGSYTLSEYFASSSQIYYLISLTAHITAVYQKHRVPSRDVESSFSVGLQPNGLKNGTLTPGLKSDTDS